MLEIGKWQTLTCIRGKEFGVYLGEEGAEETVLLPRKQVPEGCRAGDSIEVFLYMDSQDRKIATVNKPKITLGEIKKLKVVGVSEIGAFMDWGLERDIFLPFKEQTRRVEPGKEYLVRMYVDKSGRLCVSMKLYAYLRTDSPYQVNDRFVATVYEIKPIGAFVAVDDQFSGMIPRTELFSDPKVGDSVEGRVLEVREDGKLTLSLRKLAYQQMDDDCELILSRIREYDGILPFNDKCSPERIKQEFGLSKNAFKRAVGRLLKQGVIEIGDNQIRLLCK